MTVAARHRARVARSAAAFAVLALLATACSDGGGGGKAADSGSSAPTRAASASPQVPKEAGPGCGEKSVTDPADLDAGRTLARCESGAPKADPLPTRTTLKVAVPDPMTEELAPLLVARDQGEFEAENLAVELVPMDDRRAMTALDADEVDLVAGSVDAPFFDALAHGSGARLVLGGVVSANPNDTTRGQTGLWVRDNALGEDGLADLELQPVGVPNGMRASATYPIELVMGQTDVTLNEVALSEMGGLEAADKLLKGDLAAAWLEGGAWYRVAGQAGFHLAGTLPATESIDGTIASARLVGADRTVGLAYTRAIIRTVNTYLTGDYRDDSDVMSTLADATGIDAATLADLPPMMFDWEVRQGTLDRIQDSLLRLGGTTYDQPLTAERYVDRSLVADVVRAGTTSG